MQIPFLRVQPNGTVVVETIRRNHKIEKMAHAFLRSGGRYLMTVHPPKKDEPNVELVAVLPRPAPVLAVMVCEAWCFDDPALPQAIDQLVIDSLENSTKAVVY